MGRLLKAIFGEKSSDVKDSSLKTPTGMRGTVIDVQIFTRNGIKKDNRAEETEKYESSRIRKELHEEFKITRGAIYSYLISLLTNQIALKEEFGIKKNQKINKKQLENIEFE